MHAHPEPLSCRFASRSSAVILALWLGACGSAPSAVLAPPPSPPKLSGGDELLIVDCLMPGHVRQLGAFATGVSPRHPEKLPARDCAAAGGEYALASRDAAAALKLWLPFALDGDVQAQTQVGELYERGVGSLADPSVAATWYRRAAEHGDARAMVNLASLLERGLGVNRDAEGAAQWFRRASGLQAAPASITLHIIDPVVILPAPVAGQAAPSVTLAGRERALTGRVVSDAAVRSVSVNGVPTQVDAQGVFRVVPDLSRGPATLSLVASDASGHRATVTLTVTTRDADPPTEHIDPAAGVDFGGGKAYALIIANQSYRHWQELDTPQRDGRDLKAVLERRFGFRATLLANATRREILEALNDMRARLEANDRLLVFYAGHGDVDPVTRRGYWIPADGDRRARSSWVSVLDVTDQLNAVAARQVLVVADSCYSGTMARSALASVDAELGAASRTQALNTLARLRARVAMTSGGDEPVVDGGAGRNSLFMRSLLDVLSAIDRPTEAQRVFDELSARFGWRAQALRVRQRPDYAPIRFAGHEAGDFVFVPKANR